MQLVLVLCVLQVQTLPPLSHVAVVSPTAYFTAWGGIHFQYSLDTVLVIAACVVHWLLLHVSYTGYCYVSYTGYCYMCRTLVIATCVVHWLLLHVSYTGYCCMCRTLVIAACVVHWLLLHVSYTGYCCMCRTLVIAACVVHWLLLHVSYTGYCCMCRTLVIAACVVHWLLLYVSYTGYCCMCHTLVIAACVIHWLLLHVSYTGYYMCHCIAGVMCGQLDAPSNGVILPPNIDGAAYFGYTVTYSCERGYDLIGPVMRTCQADGRWNGSVPTCESEILECHEDLCVFTSLSLA